jgi:hypothetical protein
VSDNSLVLKAKQHFANFRSPEKLVEIKVPEWGVSIWYWPHLSVGEKRAIENASSMGVSMADVAADGVRRVKTDNLGRQVTEVICRSRDQHGRLLFSEADFEGFIDRTGAAGVDPEIVRRITGEMKDEYSTPETTEKN